MKSMLLILLLALTNQKVIFAQEQGHHVFFTQEEGEKRKDQLSFLYRNLVDRALDIPLGLFQGYQRWRGKSPGTSLYKKKEEVEETFSVFKSYLWPLDKNNLSFFNSQEEWLEYAPRVIGYCRGLAHMGISMNRLAIFESELSAGQLASLKKDRTFSYLNEVPTRFSFKLEQDYIKAYIKYHEGILRDIASGKIRVIPGEFEGLKDYAEHPLIEEALRWVTADFWAKNTLNLDSLEMVVHMYNEKPSLKEVYGFLEQVQNRIEMGYNSKIYFSLDPKNIPESKKLIKIGKRKYLSPTVIHVVEAYHVEYLEQGKKVRVYVWDRNYPAEVKRDYLEIDLRTGETYYPDWAKKEKYSYAEGLISDFGITREDEYMMQDTYQEWKRFRAKHPNIFKSLKDLRN